jgi:tRNA pseudouridine38-40 synthase
MPGFLLIVEYDGTAFSGWQRQPGRRTVQEDIETAGRSILGYSIRITGAGRTDKGVHALAQAASFRSDAKISPTRLRAAFNAVLPKDISISRIKRVPDTFNARFAAKHKIYRYRIWNQVYRSVWSKNYAWHIFRPLDIKAMRCAAALLLGRHDFKAFSAAHGGQKDTWVNLRRVSIGRHNGFIVVEFEADRFLYKMIRNIVGTLVGVGRKKVAPMDVARILRQGDRRQAGQTAPAQGLFMKKVLFT